MKTETKIETAKRLMLTSGNWSDIDAWLASCDEDELDEMIRMFSGEKARCE